jgi:hypothetical protein
MRERERDERVYMNEGERVDVRGGGGGIEERSSAEEQEQLMVMGKPKKG